MPRKVYDDQGRIVKIYPDDMDRRPTDKRTRILFREEIREYMEATGCGFDEALDVLMFLQRLER